MVKSDPGTTAILSKSLVLYLSIFLFWWDMESCLNRQENMKIRDEPGSRAAQAILIHGPHSTGSNPVAPAPSDAGATCHL